MKTQTHATRPILLLLLTFALLAGLVTNVAAAERAPASNATARDSLYTIEIEGGILKLDPLRKHMDVRALGGPNATGVPAALGNLGEVLRSLHPDSNVVLAPGVEKITIKDLKLRATALTGELEALRVASGYRFKWTLDNSMLFILQPVPGPETERNLEVFNLSGILQTMNDEERLNFVSRIQQLVGETLAHLRPGFAGEPPAFQFHSGANLLITIADQTALEVTRKIVSALQFPTFGMNGSPDDPLQVAGLQGGGYGGGGFGGGPSWSTFGGGGRPQGNPFASDSKGRKQLLQKLETIRLATFESDSLPLREVIRMVREEVKRQDPEGKGINFLLNPNRPLNQFAPLVPSIDPVTGLPGSNSIPVESIDIGEIPVFIHPPLADVRVIDVLDAIVKVAENPITYSVTDYAVVFSLRGADAPGFGAGGMN